MTRHSHDNVRLFQISNVDALCSLTICQENSLTVQSIAQSGDEEATQDYSSEKEPIGVSARDAKNVRHCEDSEFEPLEENMVTNCFSRMDVEGNFYAGRIHCGGKKCQFLLCRENVVSIVRRITTFSTFSGPMESPSSIWPSTPSADESHALPY
ncbi:hypothetical protein SUGI_1000450 [Cryptomeria japonica]|nr:hypothetical protein SUGI_1000450 [Cryptomeria japonica]